MTAWMSVTPDLMLWCLACGRSGDHCGGNFGDAVDHYQRVHPDVDLHGLRDDQIVTLSRSRLVVGPHESVAVDTRYPRTAETASDVVIRPGATP